MGQEQQKFSLGEKVRTDKVFLLSVIDDPIKTLIAYGIKCDDEALAELNKIAADVRERAVQAFTQSKINIKFHNACNNC